jgi:hypothetical protein
MLEVTKYDPEELNEVSYTQIIAGTLFCVDGVIQIGALDTMGKCKWHNEYFSEAQIIALSAQANEIEQLKENYGL